MKKNEGNKGLTALIFILLKAAEVAGIALVGWLCYFIGDLVFGDLVLGDSSVVNGVGEIIVKTLMGLHLLIGVFLLVIFLMLIGEWVVKNWELATRISKGLNK